MWPIDQDAIIQYLADTFPVVEILRPTDGPGTSDTYFYATAQRHVDPAHRLPFATIVTTDYGDFDNASRLERSGVLRPNIGVSSDNFRALFGHMPREDSALSPDIDFAALDRLKPHPEYARQSWVCVLNPSAATFEAVKPLLADAHAVVTTWHARGPAKPDY